MQAGYACVSVFIGFYCINIICSGTSKIVIGRETTGMGKKEIDRFLIESNLFDVDASRIYY